MRLRHTALAGAACLTVAVLPAPARAVTYEYTGIRPGTHLTTTNVGGVQSTQFGPSCTANFVFQDVAGAFDPSDIHYIGTAGHCTGFTEGATVRALVVPPGGSAPVLVTVGKVERNFWPAHDFAYIKIDPSANAMVSPSMAHWGGPTAAHPGTGSGVAAQWVGNGGYAGAAVPREGTASWSATTLGVRDTVDLSGDSGAGVLTSDGIAIGSLTRVEGTLGDAGVPADTFAQGPSIALMLSLAGKSLSVCPTADPWRGPGCPPTS